MQLHTAEGQLRVLMLKGRHAWKPHQLAWEWDLVIIDFNQLSAWDSRQCPLLQVCYKSMPPGVTEWHLVWPIACPSIVYGIQSWIVSQLSRSMPTSAGSKLAELQTVSCMYRWSYEPCSNDVMSTVSAC